MVLMRIERDQNETRLILSPEELHLLRRALERASLIDTPASEQPAIQAFCARALEILARTR
jgi:hypothetical protein